MLILCLEAYEFVERLTGRGTAVTITTGLISK